MLDINTINRVAKSAEKGDENALNILLMENRKQALIANKRIKRLEASGLKSIPAQRAQYFTQEMTDSNYFLTSKKLFKSDVDLLRQQLLELHKYNTGKTSTVSGMKRWQKQIISQFEDQGIILDTKRKQQIFTEFIQSNMFTNVKKFDSDRFFESVKDAINNGASLDDFRKAWDKYQNNTASELDAFEDYIEGYTKVDV